MPARLLDQRRRYADGSELRGSKWSYGPFPISGGDLTITITDVDDAGCRLLNQTVGAPAACNNACDLERADDHRHLQRRGHAKRLSDDTFRYTANVTGANTGATYSISGDDSQTGLVPRRDRRSIRSFPISRRT